MTALLLLGVGFAAATPSMAITRAQADAIALRTLAPAQLPGPVALFGLRSPLRAGQRIGAWSLSSAHRHMPLLRLRQRGWLFWEDLAYGADFSHPSVLLVLDNRRGRVLERVNLDMYPLIDGHPPPFVSSTGYLSPRLRVFSSSFEVSAATLAATARAANAATARSGRSRSPQPSARAAQEATGPIKKADLKGECLVTIGDRGPRERGNDLGDQALADNLTAMDKWAEAAGVEHLDSPSSREGLELTVYRAVEQRSCTDVLIYITGHGVAPTPEEARTANKKLHIGPYALVGPGGGMLAGGPPGIQIMAHAGSLLEAPLQTLLSPEDVERAITTVVNGGEISKTNTTVKVGKHPNVRFKIKIDSCWSQRFGEEIARKFSIDPARADPSKPIKIIEWASSTWEPSLKHLPDVSVYNADKTVKVTENPTINPGGISEFTNGNIRGLEAWAANPTKGRDLAAGLVQAFTDGAAQDWARTLGMTHPGAIGPGLSLGAPDDTKVSNMKLQLGGGGTTITTTTGPVTVTEGSP
jgi:hypothetical protein